jgi:hypothetical protein
VTDEAQQRIAALEQLVVELQKRLTQLVEENQRIGTMNHLEQVFEKFT